jgi:hypothetical protein
MNSKLTQGRFGLLLSCSALALCIGIPPAHAFSDELLTPFRVEAGGKPIDVDIGHAAPLATDFDGDGVFDLLVGQFGDGKLRIYRNEGSNEEPKFNNFAWFKAGAGDGKIPAG